MDVGHSSHTAENANAFHCVISENNERWEAALCLSFSLLFFSFTQKETARSECDVSWQGSNLKLRSFLVYCKDNQKHYLITGCDLAFTIVGSDLVNTLANDQRESFQKHHCKCLKWMQKTWVGLTWKNAAKLLQSSYISWACFILCISCSSIKLQWCLVLK